MAHVTPNSSLDGLHGNIDGMVFRKQGNKTLYYPLPAGPRKPASRAQVRARSTFKCASVYFDTVVKPNPELLALYRKRARQGRKARKKGGRNCRHLAIGDYLGVPKIGRLGTDSYQPYAGGLLSLVTWDDFEVVRVMMVLRDAQRAVLSVLEAQPVGSGVWHLTLPPPSPGAKPPVSVCVTAFDRPGNFAVREFLLPVAKAESAVGCQPVNTKPASAVVKEAPAAPAPLR